MHNSCMNDKQVIVETASENWTINKNKNCLGNTLDRHIHTQKHTHKVILKLIQVCKITYRKVNNSHCCMHDLMTLTLQPRFPFEWPWTNAA